MGGVNHHPLIINERGDIMRKLIYNDIKESIYFYDYGDLRFYFSSELYRDKFKAKVVNYIIEERNKMFIRYKCIVQCDDMLALTLYKKIEKRGFRVENNKSRKILNEHYIIESNVWKLSFDERE